VLGLPVSPGELRRADRVWLLRSWEDRVVPEAEIDAVASWRSAAAPGQD
jgi:hypothetical protein